MRLVADHPQSSKELKGSNMVRIVSHNPVYKASAISSLNSCLLSTFYVYVHDPIRVLELNESESAI
jgi:hypothetical protein